MNTHDNDIDKLFRTKLDDFEVEPSANVWAGISAELGGEKRLKRIIPILRIAAGITVIISAGLFFLPKKQVEIQPAKGGKLAMNPVVKPVTGQVTQSHAPTQTLTVKVTVPVQQIASVRRQHTSGGVNPAVVPQAQATVNVQPAIVDPGQAIAANVTDPAQTVAQTNNTVVSNPLMPVATTPILNNTTNIAPVFTTKPVNTSVMAAIDQTEDDNRGPAPPKKHKFSLGKVLNAMVAVVDKRQDKLIEFADSDEGETVTGINLGIIKVKKVE